MQKGFFSAFETPVDFVNKLRAVFYIMVGVTLPIFLFTYLKSRNGEFEPSFPELAEQLKYIVPILCGINSIIAYWLYEKRIRAARELPSLRIKLEEVLRGSFYKFAMLETTTILTIVAYLLTGHILFAGVYIGMLILFAMSNPTVYSVIADLRLPKKEAEIMKGNLSLEG
ncbi:hypothetical protein V6R21_31000 [Limibacter armeniacum]|uniref:hypothetical protein n=1 Tax=Limibacter armeniacum TaxID=466084 RepID=UPI002FE66567